MVVVKFPDIEIPGFKISRGQLLDVSLLGVGLVIPPFDLEFWKETAILKGFTLFDTDDVVKGVGDLLGAIPAAVWTFATSWVEQQIKEYYEKYPEAKLK